MGSWVGLGKKTYESAGVGAVNAKDLHGGLAIVGGGRGKCAHGRSGDEASGRGDAGGAEDLAGEHGEEVGKKTNWQVFGCAGGGLGGIHEVEVLEV